MSFTCSYIPPSAFNGKELNAVTEQVIDMILSSGLPFEAVAFRGLSGSLVAPVVAFRLGKNLIGVRKCRTSSHADRAVEGFIGQDYIIVDDFIETGDTCRQIIKEVDAESLDRGIEAGKCVGVFLYREQYILTEEPLPKHAPFNDGGREVPVFRRIHRH